MKEYHTENIRNVSFTGHTSSGKTTLAEALLYLTGVADRQGRVEDGNTMSDYDSEEINRKISITASILPFEYKDTKVNLVDLPGYRDFICEVKPSVRVTESMVIVVDATSGVEVGTEFAFEYAEEFKAPRMYFINKMDKERADFQKSLESIKNELGSRPLFLTIPVGKEADFKGVIDLVRMKMVTQEKGKQQLSPIPEDMIEEAESARADLVETAAEGDDELTMKFLEEEPLTPDEILRGLQEGFAQRRFTPVFCGSAFNAIGMFPLLNFMVQCCPNPAQAPAWEAQKADSDETVEMACDENGPTEAFIFKSTLDAFTGKISYVRVVSGLLKSESTLLNPGKGKDERLAHVYVVQGKKTHMVHQLHAGDIGALVKLSESSTDDTLCDPSNKVIFPPTELPNRTCHMAIKVQSKSDEATIGGRAHQVMEQDESIEIHRDSETHENIISGMGETHLDVNLSRLKELSGVKTIELSVPKVPYRETITRKGDGSYRHKKQTGGRGQFGEVYFRMEPCPEGFEFLWEVVGGNIPTKFMPAVEKGIVEAMERGILAGYPVVNVRVACYDGKHHPVDSSEMAFKTAASMGFKRIAAEAGPVILEPIYNLKVTVPEQFMGDVMGDLSSKRGKILGNQTKGNRIVVEAQVPLVEIYTYSRDLKSMTQGRGVYEWEFSHYEVTPPNLQQQIIEEAQKQKEEEG